MYLFLVIVTILILLFFVIFFYDTTEKSKSSKCSKYNKSKPFNLEKYQGKFYQIYKQNAFFETDCQASTAEYKLSDDKSELKINNVCYSINGEGDGYTEKENNLKELRSIKGFATGTEDPLIFNIEFEFGQKGVYRIFFTDYEYSIVGDLQTNYLSILSRKPYVKEEKLKSLKDMAVKYGFTIIQ